MFIKFNPKLMAPTFVENQEDLKGVTPQGDEGHALIQVLDKEIGWLQGLPQNLIAHPVQLDNEPVGEKEALAARTLESDIEAMKKNLAELRGELSEKLEQMYPEEAGAKRAFDLREEARHSLEGANEALKRGQCQLAEALKQEKGAKGSYDAACVAEGKKLLERYKGFKPTVEGKSGHPKDPHVIGEARLTGRIIEWTKKGVVDSEKSSHRKEVAKVVTDYSEARGHVLACEKKVEKLEARVKEQEMRLSQAQLALESSHQKLEESKGKAPAFEEVEGIRHEVVTCEQRIHLALGQLQKIKDVVDKFQREADELKASLVGTQSELHEVLSSWHLGEENKEA